ncbi:O-methyltransferase [Thermaerobacter litoralis]
MLPSERDVRYLESLYPPDPDLERVRAGMEAQGMPDIAIRPAYGRLLTLLVAASGARRVLEIGALAGYSAICLARGLPPGGRLISLEKNPDYARVAHAHVAAAGLADRVEIRVGDALTLMPALVAEPAHPSFDLVFIDADKQHYPDYLEWSLRLLRPGGLLVADNALMHGRVADPADAAPAVEAMRRFNRRVATDPRLVSTMLPAYDGLVLARVREG